MADYSRLTPSQLVAASRLFGIACIDSTFIHGGLAKTNYLLTDVHGEQFVLTIADSERNLPAQTTARLLHYVAQHGVMTSEPIQSTNGNVIEHFDGHCVLVKQYVKGDNHHVLPRELLPAAGAVLARIHAMPVPDWLPRGTRRMDDAVESVAQFDDTQFASWVLERLDETRSLFEDDAPMCLNHGDYFADNLVVTPANDIAVIDWDTASKDLPIIDLGFAVVGLGCVGTTLQVDRLQRFLDGYASVSSLPESIEQRLQTAAMYAATVLAHHRYRRFHILFPDAERADSHVQMQHIVDSLQRDWPT
jgi:homoserine kinase type II